MRGGPIFRGPPVPKSPSSARSRGPCIGVRTECSCESTWRIMYPRSAATAATSKAASAISVTARTPTRTRVRSWARPRLCLIDGRRVRRGRWIAGPGQPQAVADAALGVDHIGPVAGQLAPQVGDLGRHDGAGSAEVVVPHVIKQLRPG